MPEEIQNTETVQTSNVAESVQTPEQNTEVAQPEVAAAEPEKVSFSDEILDRANTLGVDDFILSKFSNNDELTRFLDIREHDIITSGRNALNPPVQDDVDSTPPAGNIAESETQKAINEFLYTSKFENPDDIDPGFMKEFNGMSEHYANLFKAQNEKIRSLEGVVESVNRLHREREIERFDYLLSSLGDEYKGLVGKGSIDTLDPKRDKAILDVRDKIWDEKQALKLGYQRQCIKPPSDKVLFDKAVNIVLASEKEKMIKANLRQKAENRNKQIIGKPFTRDSKTSITPEEKAVREFNAKMKELGVA